MFSGEEFNNHHYYHYSTDSELEKKPTKFVAFTFDKMADVHNVSDKAGIITSDKCNLLFTRLDNCRHILTLARDMVGSEPTVDSVPHPLTVFDVALPQDCKINVVYPRKYGYDTGESLKRTDEVYFHTDKLALTNERSVWEDREVYREVLKWVPQYHKYLENPSVEDLEVVIDAYCHPTRTVIMKHHPYKEYANVTLRCKLTNGLCKELYFYNGKNFLEEFKDSDHYEHLVKFALKSNGTVLTLLNKEEQSMELCEIAVKSTPYALEVAKYKSPNMCKCAVEGWGNMIKHVTDQTDELCKIALNNTRGSALNFIKDPTEEQCLLSLSLGSGNVCYLKKAYFTKKVCKEVVKENPFLYGSTVINSLDDESLVDLLFRHPNGLESVNFKDRSKYKLMAKAIKKYYQLRTENRSWFGKVSMGISMTLAGVSGGILGTCGVCVGFLLGLFGRGVLCTDRGLIKCCAARRRRQSMPRKRSRDPPACTDFSDMESDTESEDEDEDDVKESDKSDDKANDLLSNINLDDSGFLERTEKFKSTVKEHEE